MDIGTHASLRFAPALLGNPSTCAKGLTKGQGKIKLFNFNNYNQIVVDGYAKEDVRAAAKILVSWNEHPLKGYEDREMWYRKASALSI